MVPGRIEYLCLCRIQKVVSTALITIGANGSPKRNAVSICTASSFNPNITEPEVVEWAGLREAQTYALKPPKTGMAVYH